MTDTSDPCAPIQRIVDWVAFQSSGIVMDVGPGPNPFPPAQILVDKIQYPGVTHIRDLETEYLPKSDFIYCRHVVEDLNSPQHLLEQFNEYPYQVYIETPSPIHELARREGKYRGYFHHRWFVWTEGDILNFLPKLNAIDYIEVELPDKIPFEYMNNYFFSATPFYYKIWQYDLDFTQRSYASVIQRAVTESAKSTRRFLEQID